MNTIPDFTEYKGRFSESKKLILETYQYENATLPFVINYMNYWIDGELPELIPDDYFTNPAIQTEFQIKKIQKHLKLVNDNYIPFLFPWYGTVVLPSALGCQIAIPPKGEPVVKAAAISNPEEIANLKMPDFEKDGLLPSVLETIDYMKKQTDLPVSVTDPQGPLNIAICLCGVENLFSWMYLYPKEVHRLMEFCTEALIKWIKIQKNRAGQEINSGAWPHGIYLPEGFGGVWIADDDCTQLPADLYAEFVVPYNSMVFKAFGGGVLHFCGTAEHQLENFLHTDGLTAINNFCMGNFNQVKKMQELFANKLTLMVCDFAPLDVSSYYKELFGFLSKKGTIVGSFISPAYGLLNGKYESTNRDGNQLSKEIHAILKEF